MPGKSRRYTYAGLKDRKRWLGQVLLGLFIFALLYTSFSSVFFSPRVLENNTMEPNLHSGERFVFSSFVFNSLIGSLGLEIKAPSLRRGSIVLVNRSDTESLQIYQKVLDGFVRFFTLQRASLVEQPGQVFVKRIIGLPGDEIIMSNFVIRVRMEGSAYDLTEFEVTERQYTLNLPNLPGLWDTSLPFSGNMDRIVLGSNECFVLSDDRSNTNDSRTWGPVPLKNISGKALFRFWPLNRLGLM